MEELKKKVIDALTDLNLKWVEKIKAGEKGDGIDLTEMFGEFSIIIKDVDASFRDAAERAKKTKKGLW